jgi:hypothetical protein
MTKKAYRKKDCNQRCQEPKPGRANHFVSIGPRPRSRKAILFTFTRLVPQNLPAMIAQQAIAFIAATRELQSRGVPASAVRH